MGNRITLGMQSYMILTYTLFITVLVVGLGFGFYRYSVSVFEEREYESMINTASKNIEQLEHMVKDMDSVALEVISDREIIDKLGVVSGALVVKSVISDIEFRNHLLDIESFRQIVDKRINRVSVFDQQGRYYTTKRNTMTVDQFGLILEQDWYKKTELYEGRKYLRSPYVDHWSHQNGEMVFSLSRLIRNSQKAVGMVEVQQEMVSIEHVFVLDIGYEYILVSDEGQVIFSSDSIPLNLLNRIIAMADENKKVDDYLLYTQESDYLNWRLIVLEDVPSQMSKTRLLRNLTFLSAFLIIGISLVFIIKFSSILTNPIIRLTRHINEIDLSRVSVPLEYDSIYEETNQLNEAFLRLYKRLDVSIKETYKFQNMQLEAHFDLLQAQMNPHFMYNTLGVIANMGDEADQSSIAEACYDLIDMLRYSNDVGQKWTTIGDEIGHTKKYLNLMKKRYEERLSYEVQVDEKILSVPIPKLIFQPLVENSLQHAYESIIVDTMELNVVGKVDGDRFEVTISDNGSGIKEEILNYINSEIKVYKDKILSHTEIEPLKIGGMGLLSTFARLYIIYKDSLTFLIKNDEVGMSITISGRMKLNERGGSDVL